MFRCANYATGIPSVDEIDKFITRRIPSKVEFSLLTCEVLAAMTLADASVAPIFAPCQIRDNSLRYSFDAPKLAINVRKHLVWFEEAYRFEWADAAIIHDRHKKYPETRFKATGYIGNRIHVMVFCLRENSVRLISLRKANPRKMKSYAKTKT